LINPEVPLPLRDILILLFLAALWGGSFLFMRVAVPEFGVMALIFLRVGIAALILLPLLLIKKQTQALRDNLIPALAVGVINSAIPFCLIAYSLHTLSTGFASILNATTPIATAIVGLLWIGERLSPLKALGMGIGIAGVVILAWDKLAIPSQNNTAVMLAIAAGVLATFFYAWSAIYTKRRLQGVNPLALATGSQLGGSIVLLPLAWVYWPSSSPSIEAWGSAIALAAFCSALAYLLFFRLIESIGPTRATMVTFIVPVFGMFWGGLILAEQASTMMLLACGIILAGTGLATGVLTGKTAAKA